MSIPFPRPFVKIYDPEYTEILVDLIGALARQHDRTTHRYPSGVLVSTTPMGDPVARDYRGRLVYISM